MPRDISALFGTYDLNKPHESGQFSLSPTDVIVHPDWNPFVTSYDADIALLKFESNEIPYTSYIRPVCLWNGSSEPEVTEGYVVGWGKSEDETKEHENIPKKIKIPIFTNEECSLETPALASLSSGRTFCAGWQNGTGVCFGDSGNGFVIEVNNVFYLKGIVSSSTITSTKNCDVSKFAVYTNVLKFNTWINQLVNSTKKLQSSKQLAPVAAKDFLSSTEGNISGKLNPVYTLPSFNLKLFTVQPKIEPNGLTCNFLNYSWLITEISVSLEKLRTCEISDQTTSNGEFVINNDIDATVQGLSVRNTSKVISLPENVAKVFPELLVLQINDFKIKSIGHNDLRGLKNLRFLNLQTNDIEWISGDAFRDLVKLEILWLSNNKVEYLGARIFDSLVNVQKMELNGNKIEFVRENIFEKLCNLKTILLSFNNLTSIPKNLFLQNLKLESVDLSSNRIKFISSLMFDHLKNLKYVNLDSNDCIQKYYYTEDFHLMRTEIAGNCQASDQVQNSAYRISVWYFYEFMLLTTIFKVI